MGRREAYAVKAVIVRYVIVWWDWGCRVRRRREGISNGNGNEWHNFGLWVARWVRNWWRNW